MELLNCPFCNGEAELKTNHGVNGGHGISLTEIYVKCKCCGALSSKFDNYFDGLKVCIEKAVSSWNKRI